MAAWPERLAAVAFACAVLVMAGGCPSDLEDPERFVDGGSTPSGDGGGDGDGDGDGCPEGTDVEADILAMRCGGSVCHAGDSPAAGLDLVSAGVAERVVGIEGSQACGGQVLVVAGDAEASLLYQKVLPSPPCGSQMPPAQEPLTAGELACLSDWITGLSAR